MLVDIFLLIFGFVFLIKGADLLVDGASSVARKLGISNLVIGLTVVAFGTSAPELFVNVTSSLKGNSDIAIGNILGSNIANILLILGVSAVIAPLKVSRGTVWKEIPMSLLAVVLLGVMANDAFFDGVGFSTLTRTDGLALVAFFVIFLYYTFGIAFSENQEEGSQEDENEKKGTFRSAFFILFGFLGLAFGGSWVVGSASSIASLWGVSQSLIGLTIVAIGTSLPELATSAVAAYRGKVDIAVGNVVGSNIFNIFWILGLSSIIHPLPFSLASNRDILAALTASLLLFLMMFVGKKNRLGRNEGAFYLALYFSYIAYIIIVD